MGNSVTEYGFHFGILYLLNIGDLRYLLCKHCSIYREIFSLNVINKTENIVAKQRSMQCYYMYEATPEESRRLYNFWRVQAQSALFTSNLYLHMRAIAIRAISGMPFNNDNIHCYFLDTFQLFRWKTRCKYEIYVIFLKLLTIAFDFRTPLMLAAARGNTRLVQLLVESGADLDLCDKKGL